MLGHLKVLDLSRVLAGPWASQLLGDLGAKIYKVEDPQRGGDETRRWGPSIPETELSPYYLCTNRNKETLWINFQTPEGQKQLRQMVELEGIDVVLENFLPGTLKKYGLDYESLRALNPRLIYLSITGYGTGYGNVRRPGYDYILQAEAGLMSITGEADDKGGYPLRVGLPVIDLFTGMYGANAIQAALIARERTQQGTHIDLSLYEVATSILANQGMNYLLSGVDPVRQGNTHPNIVPYQLFQAKEGSFVLGVGTDRQFQQLATFLLDLPEFAEESQVGESLRKLKVHLELWSTNRERLRQREELVLCLQQIFLGKTALVWLELISQLPVPIPCGQVKTIKEVLTHASPTGRPLTVKARVLGGEKVEVELIRHPFHFSSYSLDRYEIDSSQLRRR